jgi:hypothetical protein
VDLIPFAIRLRPAVALGLLLLSPGASAQDLDPRAYARVPINATFLVTGLVVSDGAVVTDPTAPLEDLQATVTSASLGVARSFAVFGKTAQAFAGLPYSWGEASALVAGERERVTRSGLSDMRLRVSVLLRGAPAVALPDFAKVPRRTILGTSLTVVAPTGQNSPAKLINLGSNRWAFKPELAVSRPLGSNWLVDLYGAVWFFTTNSTYFPGSAARTQEPMGAFQAHISYTVRPAMWAAFDATYYVGGRSSIDGISRDDRQSNSRVGATLALPVGRRHSVKVAWSTGAIVRFGADFTTFSVGWQTAWF